MFQIREKQEKHTIGLEHGLILPIVHYKGSGKWTAATHLKDRINMDGVVWNLCIKMNATTQEAEECVANLREVKMGYWHENIEKMDIQAERRNTAEQRERAEKAEENLARGVKRIVDLEKASGMSFDEVVEDVQTTFGLSAQSAKERVDLYWDK